MAKQGDAVHRELKKQLKKIENLPKEKSREYVSKFEVNEKILNICCRAGMEVKDACSVLGVSFDVLNRYLKHFHGVSYSNYRTAQLSKVRGRLINKALSMAYEGNERMLIFCIRNLCNWDQDRNIEEKSFTLNYNVNKITNFDEIREVEVIQGGNIGEKSST